MRARTNMALISALLARAPMWQADLFTVALLNGAAYYWTSADRDVAFSGTIWSSIGPSIERSSWGAKNTTEVPELEIQLYSSGDDFGPGNIKQLIHDGLLDGAYVQLDRAFMPTFGDTAHGIVTLFGGRTGKIDLDALGAKITVTASNVLLTQNVPRNTYQLGCIHTLFDAGCTLAKSSLTASYTVASANQLAISFTAPLAPGAYVLGTMAVATGLGIGQSRSIQTAGSSAIGLAYPLYKVPAPGDLITVTQGCDKTLARCTALGNLANYRGYPFIPPSVMGI